MKIGVIGAGGIGGTIGTLWAKAGHEIFFSSRNPEKLSELITSENTHAGTVADAAKFADVILFACYYWTIDEALSAAGSLDGKILIDATNPYMREDGKIHRVPDASSGLELTAKLPNTKVVKAYNTLPTATFANEAHQSEPYAVFYCGDDSEAKAIVAQLIADSGFAGVDIGDMTQVTHQEPGGVLYNHPMSIEQAQKLTRSLI
ncbi:NADPH-dependent F420 reductase [Leptolyngbya sp. NIES-2104]|uniref:NADPH-dependent F420 reductase n=1 Tax=Leptolyngbya sp. NIES-2104 TaxID=1552121 RepID=UPI0006EC7A2A|nr:NAD(P)-binding domain-containing protein [Leptolyngbya sp. NIES-2104]GAP94086.1 putative reductase [Leptolyngbya sp. NIES-2104]